MTQPIPSSRAPSDPVNGSGRARVRRHRLGLGLLFLSSALGLLTFVDRYLSRVAAGRSAELLRVLLEEMSGAWAAALLVPLMVWLARRYTVGGKRWAQHLPLHLGFAVGVGVLHTALSATLRTLLVSVPGLAEFEYVPSLQRFLLSLPNQLIVYALVIAITQQIDRYRAARNRELEAERLHASLTEAQLEALRRQLEPHFLFTTLNAVSELIYSRPSAAEEMIRRLSALLKHAFAPSPEHEASLAEELRVLDLYLDIMRLRFAERLFVQIDVPENLRGLRVPRLLLQPLIDSALRRSDDPEQTLVAVKLIAREVDGRLKLKVVDQASSTPDAESDVGLHNAAERIRRLYGSGYGLRRRSEPEGSAVEVELPLLPSLTGSPAKTRSSGLL
jgi:two-component system LytT family sensor kinase